MIDRMFQEIEVGKVYTGKVVSITQFGAFMEVLPGKDGLVHVSELAEGRTENVEDVVKKGQFITAKCLGVDEKGRVKMSCRAWLRDQKAAEAGALLHAMPKYAVKPEPYNAPPLTAAERSMATAQAKTTRCTSWSALFLRLFILGSVAAQFLLPEFQPYSEGVLHFAPFIAAAAVSGAVVLLAFMLKRTTAAAQIYQNRVTAERDYRKSNAETLTNQLNHIFESSLQLAPTLSGLANQAEDYLNRAETEFSEGAFAPFWDDVEHAADCLATFENRVKQLTNDSRTFYNGLQNREHEFPSFSVQLNTLPDASTSVSRLSQIVRRAQKNFHFATIYEQRKTNRLLTNNFMSLASAISDLRQSISSDLARVVESGIATREALVEQSVETRKVLSQRADQQRQHEKDQLEMLDNLQRRKRPSPKLGDGKF